MNLNEVDTIVFVMLENRSFDHALGYLSTGPAAGRLPVEGLDEDQAWLAAHASVDDGKSYPPHRLDSLAQQFDDPPHDHVAIATQINLPSAGPGSAGWAGSSRATGPARRHLPIRRR